MDDKAIIGTRVRVLRAQQKPKLSQRRLAARAGVSHSTIYRLEGGEHLPGAATLVAIARVLGTSFESLIGASNEPVEMETPEERELLDSVMESNPDKLDRASVLAGIRRVMARQARARPIPIASVPASAPARSPSPPPPPRPHRRSTRSA